MIIASVYAVFKRIQNFRYSFHSFRCCFHFRIIRISSGAQSKEPGTSLSRRSRSVKRTLCACFLPKMQQRTYITCSVFRKR